MQYMFLTAPALLIVALYSLVNQTLQPSSYVDVGRGLHGSRDYDYISIAMYSGLGKD